MKQRLAKARRVVVKIGSALLVDGKTGDGEIAPGSPPSSRIWPQLARAAPRSLSCRRAPSRSGRRTLGLSEGELKLEESQAAAAVGQIALAHAWTEAFRTRNIVAAQVLVTLSDTEERRRYLNARATLTTLLEQGAVPVINENDTVATSEIRYGDNDRLAARVASMMSADCLVLLSDIDGLYTAPPGKPGATLHSRSDGDHARDRGHGGRPVSGVGSGGMITKIEAAKIALAAGCNMVIASGHAAHPLAAHRRRRALHLVSGRGLAAAVAQALDRRDVAARGPPGRRRWRRHGACARARACCRPASSSVEGSFRAAATR